MINSTTAGINIEQLEDLNSSLNVLFKNFTEKTDDFPSLDALEEAKQCLECLANSKVNVQLSQNVYFSTTSWPSNVRLLVKRLFQTFNIPQEYILMSYELCNVCAEVLGINWVKTDPNFLRLLASLSSGNLRIVLEEPSKTNVNQAVACFQLQEYFFRCVEDDDEWLSDEDATSVSKCCVETATFVCQYLTTASEQFNISSFIDVYLPIYRYICSFLNIGGSSIIEKELLFKTFLSLSFICEYLIDQRDLESAGYLMANISKFDHLSTVATRLILSYTKQNFSADRKEALIQLTSMLESLKDRTDWIDEDGLIELKELTNDINDHELNELVGYIFMKIKK